MNIQEFKSKLKPHSAILAFDYGEKRLGVAISDLLWMVASADKTIFRTTFANDLKIIQNLIAEREIGGIVYGVKVHMVCSYCFY